MLRAPDLAGRALDGRYELHAVIGEGAFGRVYRGLDRRLARAVAVKVIKPWWAEDSAWVERFEHEARLLARVNDPGVVQIFDIGHAEEGPYYVAELVEGESLAERLRRGPLDPEQARSVAERLCRALASAHAEGVLHCDVKPANVLLGSDGTVKVGDFGVARLAGGTSQGPSATVAGTPRYMSPEQARGRPTAATTDVYSAGVVLYEMLAGEPPFMDGSAVELGLRHLQDPPPSLPQSVPAGLREVVERALAKAPFDRFRDGAEMAAALSETATASDRIRHPRAGAHARPAPAHEASDGFAPDPPTAATVAIVRSGTPARAHTQTLEEPGARTRVQPRARPSRERSRASASRRRVAASRRRTRIAVPAAVLLASAGALVLLLLTRAAPRTTVPVLQGLPRGGVQARAQRLHVRPVFVARHSETAPGIAIAQSPRAGTRIADGSRVRVVLSSGPPPVTVPGVVGRSSSEAESLLASTGLRYRVSMVAAPGSTANAVTLQSPHSTASVPRGSTVSLEVAEQPRWRALTTFSGVEQGSSVPFRILGSRWRVSYSMSYENTCLLLVVCFGPSVNAQNLRKGSSAGSFELNEGEAETHVFDTGPGLYRLAVSGGHDPARWSMTVDDYY
jgi:eukaryotic-like serine/threonine-protein kinase